MDACPEGPGYLSPLECLSMSYNIVCTHTLTLHLVRSSQTWNTPGDDFSAVFNTNYQWSIVPQLIVHSIHGGPSTRFYETTQICTER